MKIPRKGQTCPEGLKTIQRAWVGLEQREQVSRKCGRYEDLVRCFLGLATYIKQISLVVVASWMNTERVDPEGTWISKRQPSASLISILCECDERATFGKGSEGGF